VAEDLVLSRLESAHLDQAVAIHREVLEEEFLSRAGEAFLRRYYRAWMASPHGVAICVTNQNGDLLGALLGSIRPADHYRSMLRNGGAGIALSLLAYGLSHPRFGAELVRTRGNRYVRALGRVAARTLMQKLSRSSKHAGLAAEEEPIGEVTHLFVRKDAQGSGIGTMLLDAMVARAKDNKVSSLVLVTPPHFEARRFYEKHGWVQDKELTSASGERFVRYKLYLSG
jgi:GNAT superfamily N-acetyltransferase